MSDLLIPQHIAIIMDGNGRWAKAQKKPRTFGHKHGTINISRITKKANELNVKYLSLFAFSCENWDRPTKEVDFLIKLLNKQLQDKKLIERLNKGNIKFNWIGFKDKMPSETYKIIKFLMDQTKKNSGLTLTIAFNYGGMQDIIQAAKKIENKSKVNPNDFLRLLLTKDIPFVDLLIRTGNEKRISNFLIYQSAYAEIIFEPKMWPEYLEEQFVQNIEEYNQRQRRFGVLNENK